MRRPRWPATAAHIMPAAPAPMTATSNIETGYSLEDNAAPGRPLGRRGAARRIYCSPASFRQST
ncbi:Uncharacterised protein [Bordetella pertussis]|nr:Uncharacterised protein [Bordetella pertussis]